MFKKKGGEKKKKSFGWAGVDGLRKEAFGPEKSSKKVILYRIATTNTNIITAMATTQDVLKRYVFRDIKPQTASNILF